MQSSLDGTLTNPSTGSSRLFHYQPMTKTPDLDELPKMTNTSLKLYVPNKDTYITQETTNTFLIPWLGDSNISFVFR